jgi:PAS domain S-box-containing protein
MGSNFSPLVPTIQPSRPTLLSRRVTFVRRFQYVLHIVKYLSVLILIVLAPDSSRVSYGQAPTKRILIITGYDPGHPAVTAILSSITSTMRQGSQGRVEFFYEFLENLRVPNSKYEPEMVSYLQRKYEGEKIDLILALGGVPLKFLLDHEGTLFSGVPKVYYFHDDREEKARSLWPRVTGVWADVELKKTLALALTLHPDTQNVVVVSGNSEQDKFLREEALTAFHDDEAKLHFTHITDVTGDQLKQSVATLPPKSVIIFLSFFVDKEGNSYSGPEALSLFAPSSNAPIYGISDTYMGAGIVGGNLLDFDGLGKRTGQVALRMLNGEKPENIPPQSVPTIAKFDWRELKRWHLDERKLPQGAIVLYRVPTFWELYKWYAIIAAVLILLQAFLITRLLITRARRRHAELESYHLALLAEAEHKRLDSVVSNVPGLVWETRIDPQTNERKTTFVSEHVQKMLGYSAEEWLSIPNFGLSIVHEDDRERAARESEAIFSTKEQGVVRFRWITKDGRTLWVEAHLAPILDKEGNAIGLRGFTLDISEQQQSEEARRQSEERNRAILEAVPDLMFLQTRDGVYLDYHAKDPKDLAVPPEKFLGKNVMDVLPRELATQFLQHFQRAELGEPQIMEYELDVNGHHGWFEARIVRSGDNILSVVRDMSARKLVEIALSQNEAQLAGIIGSAMDAIITVDQNQNVVLFNTAAERLFLCSAPEALGQPLDRFIPERFREVHRRHIQLFGEQRVMQRSMSPVGDIYGLRTSGEEFPIEASISQIEVNGEKFFTVVLRDITERKRAVDDLRQSEQRFAKSFRANPQPMSLTTIAGGLYLDVNESFLAMSGYTREEVIGHTSIELRIWETNDLRADFIRQLDQQGSVVNREVKFRTKDGSLRVLLSSAEKLEIGGRECLLIASSDITDRDAAQTALRESEARFRNMADTAPVMIWVAGQNKQCTYVNKKWLEFTGHNMEEELGEGWIKGIHKDDRDRCLETFSTSFDDHGSFEMEYRLRRHDGEYRWLLDTGAPRFSSHGQFLGYIGSCLDITERKQSEVDLKTAVGQLNELKNQLEAENIYLQEELQFDHAFGEIVGNSDAIKYVLFKVQQVAPTDSTVLITGETGTGKELVARAIHGASSRQDRPLIKVNCAALAPTLIESELFGHEKGAFTGAAARKLGRFELANGGTIFLDEIAELTTDLQAKLLRVIQENEFERLGGTKTLKADVRIIAATNRNLKAEVEAGNFREDLWYRLNVYPITVPPLRQRKEDIPLLVEHFVAKYSKRFGKRILTVSPRAMHSLQAHSWPGNVRELASAIERAIIHTQGSTLQIVDRFESPVEEPAATTMTLEEIERDYILRTLENTGWRIEGAYGAAKILGMNPSTLRTRMLKLGIQRRRTNFA